jgi:dTMP kinase
MSHEQVEAAGQKAAEVEAEMRAKVGRLERQRQESTERAAEAESAREEAERGRREGHGARAADNRARLQAMEAARDAELAELTGLLDRELAASKGAQGRRERDRREAMAKIKGGEVSGTDLEVGGRRRRCAARCNGFDVMPC